MSTGIRKVAVAAGLVVAIVGAATGLEAIRGDSAVEGPDLTMASGASTEPSAGLGAETSEPQTVAELHDVAPDALSRAFRAASQTTLPSVVYVEVESEGRVATNALPFWPFDNRQQPQIAPQPERGSGSGVVFREDGYIITNNHVVETATRVRVTMPGPDGREFVADVVGRDPNTDIALIKVDASGLPVAEFGNSDDMQVGDWVVALGYPLQLGSTATAGIVSAKGRNLGILRANNQEALEHFIQTDAAINPGNSGGPLVDLDGRVIGINTAIASRTGFYSGYGFAVPANIVKRVVGDLIQYGESRRPRLGVGVSDLSAADVEVYKLDSSLGAEITQLTPGTAAARAGLQLGDVVVALDGKPMRDSGQLTETLALYRPGQQVTLDVIRYGKKMTFKAELEMFEPAVRGNRPTAVSRERGMNRLGFAAADITTQHVQQFELPAREGVVITAVDPGGPAARILGPGLIIDRLNGQRIGNLADLEKAAEDVKPGSAVSIVVRTPNNTQSIINYRLY
ncbi:MAG: trypsin-like peptidase domain-containing protein [Gemmatimonadetes bacterium]|nr:trypsin-like peptidase domain-containing protein [Gemmatimonadota bacterium]